LRAQTPDKKSTDGQTVIWQPARRKNQFYSKSTITTISIRYHYSVRPVQFTDTTSIWKFSSFPASSWLASKVIVVSSFAVTVTGKV